MPSPARWPWSGSRPRQPDECSATRPDEAAAALERIEIASRTAVDDLRRMLVTLREGPTAPRGAAPGLAQLDDLSDELHRTGLTVSVTRTGMGGLDLPQAVDQAAYRIVQEALTNALKHGSADTARVELVRSADGLEDPGDEPARRRRGRSHADRTVPPGARGDGDPRAGSLVRRAGGCRPDSRWGMAGRRAPATRARCALVSPTDPIRVVLVDDQAMVRSGLRLILESESDLRVVGEASDGRAAIDVVSRLRPDLVLMDIQMPAMDGLEATRRLVADAGATVLILTTFDLDEYVFEALRAGAAGFLLKNAPAEELSTRFARSLPGTRCWRASITRRVIDRFVERRPRPEAVRQLDRLSSREREVLLLVAEGLSNGEIADRLVLGRGDRQDAHRQHPRQARPS